MREKIIWQEIPQVTELAEGQGSRFIFSGEGEHPAAIRILADKLGIFQAFVE